MSLIPLRFKEGYIDPENLMYPEKADSKKASTIERIIIGVSTLLGAALVIASIQLPDEIPPSTDQSRVHTLASNIAPSRPPITKSATKPAPPTQHKNSSPSQKSHTPIHKSGPVSATQMLSMK